MLQHWRGGPLGKPFTKILNVRKGKVQPLWIGVDIARDIEPGTYTTNVVVRTRNAGEKQVSVTLDISGKVLEDRGDSETWRHSRLRWLNSTAGIDDKPVAPYDALQVRDANHLSLTGKEVAFDRSGLPLPSMYGGARCWRRRCGLLSPRPAAAGGFRRETPVS